MTVVNIVSGKGGTGKTLISAVLADVVATNTRSKVLLIDLDIFVRGLTSLLYYENEKRTLLKDEYVAISDILMDRGQPQLRQNVEPGVLRYRTFDIWVAVRRIDDILPHTDVFPRDFEQAREQISRLLSDVRRSYDLILLDNRAGFDELVAASHSIGDVTINIADSDLVSKVTSENLEMQLKSVCENPIYRITNKSIRDERTNFNEIGRIPFDAEIIRTYGSEGFWHNLPNSIIASEASLAWNRLAEDESIPIRFTPPQPRQILKERSAGGLLRLELQERFVLAICACLIPASLYLLFASSEGLNDLLSDPLRLLGGTTSLVSFFIAAFTVLGFFRRK